MSVLMTGDKEVLKAYFDPSKKLGVVYSAGGVRNYFTAGAQKYLIELKSQIGDSLQDPVACIGVSSGYATRAYLHGYTQAGDEKVYSEDMSTDRGKLFRLSRLMLGKWPFDVDYVEAVFKHGVTGRAINAHKVISHKTKLYGVLADPKTGHGFSYLPKTAYEVWRLATIATAVTGFARPTRLNGRAVTDGYASDMHLPVAELIRLHPELTDVIVFASQHYNKSPKLASWLEMMLYKVGLAVASKPMQEMIRTRHVRFMSEAKRVITKEEVGGRRVCIIWLPCEYHPVYVSKEQSEYLIKLGYETMKKRLQQARA